MFVAKSVFNFESVETLRILRASVPIAQPPAYLHVTLCFDGKAKRSSSDGSSTFEKRKTPRHIKVRQTLLKRRHRSARLSRSSHRICTPILNHGHSLDGRFNKGSSCCKTRHILHCLKTFTIKCECSCRVIESSVTPPESSSMYRFSQLYKLLSRNRQGKSS